MARCTVARRMRAMGLQGAVRAKTPRSTLSDRAAPCRTVPHRAAPCRTVPLGAREPPVQGTRAGPALGGRFHACRDRGRLRPRRARHRPRSDGGRGSLVDAFARRIVGGRVSRTAHAGFALDALEQATHPRRPAQGAGPVARSDRGSPHVAIRHDLGAWPRRASSPAWARSATAPTPRRPRPPSASSRPKVIRRRGPWRGLEAVAFATLEPKVRAQQRMGPRVQPPTAPRAHRERPARRGRGAPPRAAGGRRDGGIGSRRNRPRESRRGSSTTAWCRSSTPRR